MGHNGPSLGAIGSAGTGWTDVHGQFVIDGLSEGSYSVAAGGGVCLHGPSDPARKVDPGSAPVELRVTKGMSLSGRLVDPRGRPVQTQGLQAGLVNGGWSEVSWTRVDDREGRLVIAGLRPGRVRVSMWREQEHVMIGEADAPGTDVTLVVPDK